MKTFNFRLQKVLEYRDAMEQYAQDAYLDSRVARLEAEAAVLGVEERREKLLQTEANTIEDRRALEASLLSLADDEREKQIVVQVLAEEEDKAFAAWQEKKREAQVLEKLRDKEYAEFQLEQARRIQAELDEWSVLRRSA